MATVNMNGNLFNIDEERLRRERQARMGVAEPVMPEVSNLPEAPAVDVPVVEQAPAMNATAVDVPTQAPIVNQDVAVPSSLMSGIAKNESGNNAGIGYHNQATGSAWGKYGMTSAAYQDVQSKNPAFANRDLTTLNEQEQDAAASEYANVVRDQLRAQGLDATDNEVSAAWFLGAGGLANYMRDGSISDAAAKANGGRANVQRIVESRLSSQEGAASGAAQLSPLRLIESNYNDGVALVNVANDDTTPMPVRQQAAQRSNELINEKIAQDNAQQTLVAAQGGDPKAQAEFAKTTASGEPSLLKAFLYNAIGMETVAKEMMADLGYGKTRNYANLPDENGKPLDYSVEIDTRGRVLNAWDSTGNKVDEQTLARIQSSPMAMAGGLTVGQASAQRVRDSEGTEWTQNPTNKGMLFTNNSGVRGVPVGQTTPITAATDLNTYSAKKNIDLAAESAKLRQALDFIPAQERNKYISQFNAENGTNFGLAAAPDGTYQITMPNAPAPVPQAGPQVVASAPTAAAPTAVDVPTQAPVVQAPVVPTQTQAPVVRQQAAPTSTSAVNLPPQPQQTQGESPAAFKARMNAWEAQVKDIQGAEATKVASAENVFNIVKDINDNVRVATGSGIGSGVDTVLGWFGQSTEGADAIVRLEVLGDSILKAVPRFEGPQSDKDTETYRKAAGQLSDAGRPVSQKIAALKSIIDINKKYAPELPWDDILAAPTDTTAAPTDTTAAPTTGGTMTQGADGVFRFN